MICVKLPITREGPGLLYLNFVLSQTNLRMFMQSIYDFYHQPVKEEQLQYLEHLTSEDEEDLYGNIINIHELWNLFRRYEHTERPLRWIDVMCLRDNPRMPEKDRELNFFGSDVIIGFMMEILIS